MKRRAYILAAVLLILGVGVQSFKQVGVGSIALTDFARAGFSANPVLGWNKTYGGTWSDLAVGLVQTTDGGHVLAGRTNSYGAGMTDFWLVRTDVSGNHLWNQTYGGVGSDLAMAFLQTTDGGYALTGPTYSYGAGNGDFWLVRTDADGDAQWNQTYGGAGGDYAGSVIQTSDGGYALAGGTGSFGAGSDDFLLVKTDSSGMIPEFQSALALPLLMSATIVGVIAYSWKRRKQSCVSLS